MSMGQQCKCGCHKSLGILPEPCRGQEQNRAEINSDFMRKTNLWNGLFAILSK